MLRAMSGVPLNYNISKPIVYIYYDITLRSLNVSSLRCGILAQVNLLSIDVHGSN